jgi:hypothetical protein
MPWVNSRGKVVYYRIADYDPNRPSELVPSLLREDALSSDEALANPDTLINPKASYNYSERDSDFLFFKWHQRADEPNKQFTTTIFDDRDRSMDNLPEPMEIIYFENSRGAIGLRDALANGIKFSGLTTREFFIVYAISQGKCEAILCSRSDFNFQNGKLTLIRDIANPRATALSAPKVVLRSRDIIESPFLQTHHRSVYAKLDRPETVGTVLLRSLDYYAADYVKWFVNEQSISISKSDRRAIAAIIDTALSKPVSIETYLGSGGNDAEVKSLRQAIADYASGADESLLSSIASALLNCEPCHEKCVQEVLRDSSGAVAEIQKQIAIETGKLESVKAEVEKKSSEAKGLEAENAAIRAQLAESRKAVDKAEKDKEVVLSKLEDDVALKLGLRAVTRNAGSSSDLDGGIEILAGAEASAAATSEKPVDALSKNLKRFGLVSLISDTATECRRLAGSVLAALSATSFLVAPAGIAHAIADALSITSSGVTARRIYVPSECCDIDGVANACEGEESVVVVENVIDSVNEGILLPLIARGVGTVVVFPYVSLDSMDLIAKEAWGSMFMLGSYPLTQVKHSARLGKMMTAAARVSEMVPAPSQIDDVIDQAKIIAGELSDAAIPYSSLPLVSSISLALEDLVEDADIAPCVAQHLAVASRAARKDPSAAEALQSWDDGDAGLTLFIEEYTEQE